MIQGQICLAFSSSFYVHLTAVEQERQSYFFTTVQFQDYELNALDLEVATYFVDKEKFLQTELNIYKVLHL